MERKTQAVAFLTHFWITTLLTLMLAAVAVSAQATETAEQRFRAFEALLTRAGRFDLQAHVVSTGVIASDLTADVGVANAGIVVIRMKGTFNGKPDDVALRTDGIVTMIGRGGEQTRLQPGKGMRQAVQIGFARVGLWHNLMLLSHDTQPERNEGGILQWTDVANVRYASPAKKGLTGLTFDVVIEGASVGHATLWFDDTSQMPVRREQTITIEGKTIKTVEDYAKFIPTA